MNELIGIKWKNVPEETKEQLLKNAHVWEEEKLEEGYCIYDLTEELSVGAEAKLVDDVEEPYLNVTIPPNSIIYNPETGVMDKATHFELNINKVMTVQEASELWGLSEGAIRLAIKSGRFIAGVEYRKAGRITLITRSAMERVYGEL